jgi:hypothetical protein
VPAVKYTKREYAEKRIYHKSNFHLLNNCKRKDILFFLIEEENKREIIYRLAGPVVACNRAIDEDELRTDNSDPS